MINSKNYLALVFILFILLGCENNENATNKEQMLAAIDNHSVNLSNNTKSSNNFESKELQFKKFILNINYENNQSTEIVYEKKSIGIEAEMIDTQTSKKIIGKEAFSKIQSLLLKLKLHKGTPASDVKEELISLFNIRDDYQKIELEIGFTDGLENKYVFIP